MKAIKVSFDGHGLNVGAGANQGERVATCSEWAKDWLGRTPDGNRAKAGERLGDLFPLAAESLEVLVRVAERLKRHCEKGVARTFLLDPQEMADMLEVLAAHRKIMPIPTAYRDGAVYPEPWSVESGIANVVVVDAEGSTVAVFTRSSEDVGAAEEAAWKMVKLMRMKRSIEAAAGLVKGLS